MEAHVAAGRPAAALDAYARGRLRLDDDLGVDPAPETEALYLAVLRRESLPAPTEETDAAGGDGRRGLPPGAAAPVPLLGRGPELQALDAALEQAARGAVRVLLLEGEAGIGKTRILEAWAPRAAAAGAVVLRARGDELARGLPLQPLLDALDGHLRALPAPGAVLALLGDAHGVLAPLLPSSPPAPRVDIDPAGGRAVLFAALRAVFSRLAAGAPVAVLLDDLHFADRATAEWLHFAAQRSRADRLLCVGAVRPEEGPPAPLPGAQRVPVGPLDLDTTARLVGATRAADLHARSGGHPLFLLELAAAGEAGEVQLPVSLRQAVADRCARAGAAAPTLRAAAVLGPAVDPGLLADVLRVPPLTVLEHLEEGVRRRLLDERGQAFGFRHGLVGEALAADVGAARRALLHLEAGRALAARPAAEPLEVAHHARLGGDTALAAAALTEAATRAGERFDHGESGRLLDAALALEDTAARRLRRARARTLGGDYRGAEADALVAFERGAGPAALEAAGWAAYYRRDFAAARRYAADGARLAGPAEPSAHTRCLALAGRVATIAGDLHTAEASLEAAVALADEPLIRALPAAWLAHVRNWQGRPDEALPLAQPGTLSHQAPDLLPVALHAWGTSAHALAMLGRADDALAALDVLDREVARQGVTRFAGRAANFRSWVLRGLGQDAEADDWSRRALEDSRRAGSSEAEANALLDLADSSLRRRDPERARGYLSAAAPLQRRSQAFGWRQSWRERLLGGRSALLTDRAAEAVEAADALRDEAAATGDRRYTALAALLAVQARAALDEPVDRPAVGSLLEGLGAFAGLEAWWITAETAAATGVEAFWSLAEAHAARLAAEAGPRAAVAREAIRARLDGIRARLQPV